MTISGTVARDMTLLLVAGTILGGGLWTLATRHASENRPDAFMRGVMFMSVVVAGMWVLRGWR